MGLVPILLYMLDKEDLQRRIFMWKNVESKIHDFFSLRGFTHVRTPLIVRSPGMEVNLDPITMEVNGVQSALITSPEYSMKKLVGSGLKKIYTITQVFRNNEFGNNNIPEFTMLEWYAPGNYEDLMNETQDLLNNVLDANKEWPRINFLDANVDDCGDPHVKEDRFFIARYPKEEASLAKLSKNGKYAERFEAFADGMELCNGFVELTDSVDQRKRFEKEIEERKKQNKKVFPIDEDFLKGLESIKQSIYGNALGIDRLVMLKYGIHDINDIQLFPDRFNQ